MRVNATLISGLASSVALAVCAPQAATAQGDVASAIADLVQAPTPPPGIDFDPAAVPYDWEPGDYATAWDQYQARQAAAGGGTKHTEESVPDWSGIWEKAPGPSESFTLRPGEPLNGRGFATVTSMKLTPLYAAEHEMRMRAGEEGRDFDPLTWCLPSGFPRWLVEPFLKEFTTKANEVWLTNEPGNEIRRIYTDGRGHIPEDFAYPMWFGDSIGFWDGDTLVIHTNNIKANLYQREQPAHSDELETVEEWTEIAESVMQVKVSLYDPLSLQEPFHFVRYFTEVYNPDGTLRINHWSCAENQPVVRTRDGGSEFGTLPSDEAYVDYSDPESWLAFDEAREAGLLEGIE